MKRIFACVGLGLMTGCGGSVSSAVSAPAPVVATPTPPAPAPKSSPPPVDCTAQTGSFQLVATGFSTDVVGNALYKFFPCEHYALVFLPGLSGTSNGTSFTASPLPDFLIPVSLPSQESIIGGYDNGVEVQPLSVIIEAGSSTLRFLKGGDEHGWTSSGGKGAGDHVITVFLD